MIEEFSEGDVKMIEVVGEATLKVRYSVELDITEEEFDNLSERKQDALIDEAINWHETLKNAETDEIEVDDVYEK